MLSRIRRSLRRVQYDLRGGFLVRPLLIAIALGCLGASLPALEERHPSVGALARGLTVLSTRDASTAQGLLSTIAGAIMTVVSIVLSVLLIALTLASIQFSPRLLNGFVRDRLTQHTIGVFLGTFLYCLCAYAEVRPTPGSPVPSLSVLVALGLAVVCVGSLIAFVHHIARLINASYIVDRIALETERVIDEVFPHLLVGAVRPEPELPPGLATGRGASVFSEDSGYIRYIDDRRLLGLAKEYGEVVLVHRRVGQFIPAGSPLLQVATRVTISQKEADEFLDAFDIGVVRTMEQDVEFGVLQLVDIALKAISPAVNDPSTAIGCIDQLSRVLVRLVSRRPPPARLYSPPGVLRVVLAPTSFERLLDVAFSQIRHYSRADMAVSLRLLRALGDIAAATHHAGYLDALRDHARRVATACLASFPEDEGQALRERRDHVIRLTAHAGNRGPTPEPSARPSGT